MERDEALYSTAPVVTVACGLSWVGEFCFGVRSISIRRSKQSTRWRRRNKSDAQAIIEWVSGEADGAAAKSVQATGM